MTKFEDFDVDIENLARGLLNIIYEHPDAACLSYGMMPADVMLSFEKVLSVKIPDSYIKNHSMLSGTYIRQRVQFEVIARVLELAVKDNRVLV
jgi:hypothetical protein